VSFIPSISIGSHQEAFLIAFPVRSNILLTLPYVLCTTMISPTFNVPVIIISDVSIHCFADFLASITTPTALLFGLYFSSNTSACSAMVSKSSSIHCPVTAETFMMGVSPHRSSGIMSYFPKSALICSVLFAHGLSIFVMAIMIGTPDSFA